jgi:hypothetical protein
MKKILFLLPFLFWSYGGFSSSINYEHRLLLKAVKEFGAEIKLEEFSYLGTYSLTNNKLGKFFHAVDND